MRGSRAISRRKVGRVSDLLSLTTFESLGKLVIIALVTEVLISLLARTRVVDGAVPTAGTIPCAEKDVEVTASSKVRASTAVGLSHALKTWGRFLNASIHSTRPTSAHSFCHSALCSSQLWRLRPACDLRSRMSSKQESASQ
jgi:hypothetical protein